MAKKDAATKVRILRDVTFEGRAYKPDEVVELLDAAPLVDDGAACAHPESVAYCIAQGATVIKHSPNEAQ